MDMREVYLAGQAEFEKEWPVGSKIKVLFAVPSRHMGWGNTWVSEMNEYIDREHVILEYDLRGVELSRVLSFPYYCLQGVSKPEVKPAHEFKPFDKVLVRDESDMVWECDFFCRSVGNKFFCIGGGKWTQCIPYEGNEHLVGMSDKP